MLFVLSLPNNPAHLYSRYSVVCSTCCPSTSDFSLPTFACAFHASLRAPVENQQMCNKPAIIKLHLTLRSSADAPQAKELVEKITAQGLKVRDLKGAKAEQAVLDQEVWIKRRVFLFMHESKLGKK